MHFCSKEITVFAGQATAELLLSEAEPIEGEEFNPEEPPKGFDRVTGVDPSAQMIEGAKAYAATLGARGAALNFIQGPAEKLAFLEDKSVDLVTAGALVSSIQAQN